MGERQPGRTGPSSVALTAHPQAPRAPLCRGSRCLPLPMPLRRAEAQLPTRRNRSSTTGRVRALGSRHPGQGILQRTLASTAISWMFSAETQSRTSPQRAASEVSRLPASVPAASIIQMNGGPRGPAGCRGQRRSSPRRRASRTRERESGRASSAPGPRRRTRRRRGRSDSPVSAQASYWTSRPALTTAIRSARRIASSTSWVTKTTVFLSSLWMERNSSWSPSDSPGPRR